MKEFLEALIHFIPQGMDGLQNFRKQNMDLPDALYWRICLVYSDWELNKLRIQHEANPDDDDINQAGKFMVELSLRIQNVLNNILRDKPSAS